MTGFHYIIIRKLNLLPDCTQTMQSFYFFLGGVIITFASHFVAPVLNFTEVDGTDALIIVGIVFATLAQ